MWYHTKNLPPLNLFETDTKAPSTPRSAHQPSVWGMINSKQWVRAVFKWLSKEITWLGLLLSVIGLKDSRQFFNQWEAKPKPITRTRYFSRAMSELQIIAGNGDWFIALFVPVVIAGSNCFGFGFSKNATQCNYSFENRCLPVGIICDLSYKVLQ